VDRLLRTTEPKRRTTLLSPSATTASSSVTRPRSLNSGNDSFPLKDDADRLYTEFARHILLELNGLVFVRTVQDLLAAGKEVTLNSLPKALKARGIRVPATGTHLSAIKGWLRAAGVFEAGRASYAVNDQRVEQLLGGLSSQDLDALTDLNDIQRAFLRSLARFPSNQWSRSNEVAQLAEALYGVEFPWKSIASSVLDACKQAGFLDFRKTTGGRGAKPHLVKPTAAQPRH